MPDTPTFGDPAHPQIEQDTARHTLVTALRRWHTDPAFRNQVDHALAVLTAADGGIASLATIHGAIISTHLASTGGDQ